MTQEIRLSWSYSGELSQYFSEVQADPNQIRDAVPTSMTLRGQPLTVCDARPARLTFVAPLVSDTCSDVALTGTIVARDGITLAPGIVLDPHFRATLTPGTYRVKWEVVDANGNQTIDAEDISVGHDLRIYATCELVSSEAVRSWQQRR